MLKNISMQSKRRLLFDFTLRFGGRIGSRRGFSFLGSLGIFTVSTSNKKSLIGIVFQRPQAMFMSFRTLYSVASASKHIYIWFSGSGATQFTEHILRTQSFQFSRKSLVVIFSIDLTSGGQLINIPSTIGK